MKRFNRLVSAAVVSAMVLAMAGCGNTGAGSGSQSADSSGAENAQEGTSAQASSGSGAGSFMIGSMGPLTGDNAVYGIAVQNAAQLAVDEINAAGGVNGYTLELNFQDDEADPEKAVNAYNVL